MITPWIILGLGLAMAVGILITNRDDGKTCKATHRNDRCQYELGHKGNHHVHYNDGDGRMYWEWRT